MGDRPRDRTADTERLDSKIWSAGLTALWFTTACHAGASLRRRKSFPRPRFAPRNLKAVSSHRSQSKEPDRIQVPAKPVKSTYRNFKVEYSNAVLGRLIYFAGLHYHIKEKPIRPVLQQPQA